MTTITAQGTLELSEQQIAALAGLAVIAVALSPLLSAEKARGEKARDSEGREFSVTKAFASVAESVVSGTTCPFDHPPATIQTKFNSRRDMYLRCLHATPHCWTTNGQYMQCPP